MDEQRWLNVMGWVGMGLGEYGVTGHGAEEMTVGWVDMGLCGCGVREGIESLTLGVGRLWGGLLWGWCHMG